MKLILLDEAGRIFPKAQSDRYDLGDSPTMQFLRSARKIEGDTSVIMADQVPSKLDETITANCDNIICFALGDSTDVREAGNALGLERYLHRELVELGDREVIVRLGRYSHRRLKIHIDEITFPKSISRDEARRRSQALLDSIPFVRRHPKDDRAEVKADDAQADEDGLSAVERRWFADFVREPWLLTRDLMMATGLDRDANDSIRNKFEARGCVAFDSVVGAKYKTYCPTERGLELADKLGLPVGSTGKGGVGHECMIVYFERSLEQYFAQSPLGPVRFLRAGAAATTGGVQADLLVIRGDGRRFACQVCHRNQPAYEAQAILRLHALTLLGHDHADAVDLVMAIARNKSHKRAIEKAVKRRNGSMPGKVVVLDFDTMLGIDWDEVFTD